ncbi:MAG: biopolymer transporter ExbD [Planctomycetes bacterium]|nr:biopolymer transporter ExbD [Planctomycetota bacterium]
MSEDNNIPRLPASAPRPAGGAKPPGAAARPPAEAHYVKPRKKKEVETTKIHPPLLALIDVLFTLMMFFIIAARTKLAEGEIPGSLPKIGGAAAAASTTPQPITITVRPIGDGNFACQFDLDGQALTEPGQLYEILRRKQAAYGPGTADTVPVIIRPIQAARWKWVVEAFNQALRAQFKEIGFSSAG